MQQGRRNPLIVVAMMDDVGVVTFTTTQVLDELNVQQLGEELLDLVEKRYIVKMVINFENIKFLSSAVLGKLISLNKRLAAEKGRLAFCCIQEDILQVFRITRLDKLIPILDTESEAINKVRQGGLFSMFRKKR